MSEIFTKSTARNIYFGGSVFFIFLFLGMTWHTNKALPSRDNSQAITEQVAFGKRVWEENNCIGCHSLLGEGAYYAPELGNVFFRYGKSREAIKAFIKSRDKLLNSFSKDEQTKLGMGVPYVFIVRLGTYGTFNAPVELYDQDYLITVPVNEKKTAFIAGMFYNLKDAQKHQKKMQKNGFESASIAAFKDGEITEF